MAMIKRQALLQQSKTKKAPSSMSVNTIMAYILVIGVMAFFLFATYRCWTQRSKFQTEDISDVKKDNSFDDHTVVHVPKYAVINTSKGPITVQLYRDSSPDVIYAFTESCQSGRFEGMLFNLVIKNFAIQGGDVKKPGVTEYWTSRGKHYKQLDTVLKNEAFMLGTSKDKTDGGVLDLFIITAPIPDLNEKIDVFGRVIKGEDIVQEIEEADTDELYRPKAPIRITNVSLKKNI